MKKTLTASVLAIIGAFCMNANAATAVGNVTVGVNLTSQCQINSIDPAAATTITGISIPYTSFQTAIGNANSSFIVRCTNGITFGIGLDAVTGSARGISYVAALGTAVATGLTVDGAALSGLTGVGAGTTYYVNTSAAAGQAGNSTVTTQTRVVTVTY